MHFLNTVKINLKQAIQENQYCPEIFFSEISILNLHKIPVLENIRFRNLSFGILLADAHSVCSRGKLLNGIGLNLLM